MYKYNSISTVIIKLIIFSIILSGCHRKTEEVQSQSKENTTEVVDSTHYDFLIENSGSMKGFFNGNTKAKTIIKLFYDRIDEQKNECDTITFNLINTDIVRCNNSFDVFRQQIHLMCNAKLSKIDDIIEMAMNNSNTGDVSLLISDYCFESNSGNFEDAKSGITKLFTKQLISNDIAVAIFKFMSDFHGKYYPGGISCNQDMPFYIWVFGPAAKVKKITQLPNIKKEDILVLQNCLELESQIQTKNARMKSKDGSVIVKNWKKNRHSDDYTLKINFNISQIILNEIEMGKSENYRLSEGYVIESIDINGNDCVMTITTKYPSPGMVCIEYKNHLPSWVEDSNYESNGIPSIGKTLGIKYLIEGVYDAYNNKTSNVFKTKIIMK